MLSRVVLATRNEGKRAELEAMLSEAFGDVEVLSADQTGLPEVVEDGASFAENAMLKAQSAAAHTGLPAIADDSGLTVDIMGGAPGIFSARWSGTHGDDAANTALLLAQLADVRDEHRGAAFTCAAAFAPAPSAAAAASGAAASGAAAGAGETGGEAMAGAFVCEGRFAGSILRTPRGDGGFGYDPVFRPEGSDRSLAEYSSEEKNAVSHRKLALSALIDRLRG